MLIGLSAALIMSPSIGGTAFAAGNGKVAEYARTSVTA